MIVTSQIFNRFCKRIIAAVALPAVVVMFGTVSALAGPLPGAIFTTDSTCSGVNLNIYTDKGDVYIDGGPAHPGSASLPDGCYYVQVTDPSGAIVLGTSVGSGTEKPFCVVNQEPVSCYQLASILIDTNGVAGYNDTPNHGGVYKVWVSTVSTFDNDSTKTDNFKVNCTDCDNTPPEGVDLAVGKDAAGTYDHAYTWTITKDVDKTLVKQVGGSATFNYTVNVSHDAGADGNYVVSGTITVTNLNNFAVTGVDVTDSVTDINAVCAVTDGAATTIPANSVVTFPYSCSYSAAPTSLLTEDNTVTVTWPDQMDSDGNILLFNGFASFTVEDFSFTQNDIDECVAVTDTCKGDLGNVCVGDTNPNVITYSCSFPVPQFGCLNYTNTVSFTTIDTSTTGSAKKVVTVCGPERTGALTIGFWQNKNGQSIITSGASAGTVCKSGCWLRQYAPFQDLSATATCAQVASYVTTVIKAANASGAAMNAMLKAQMLATALDVYFSDPALGGNKINAPAPIGGKAIDLTKICKMIDSTGGTATCSGALQNTSSAFGGATSLTVSQILAYAASRSNSGGIAWYGQVKATQELAKNTFDAINNQVAFAP